MPKPNPNILDKAGRIKTDKVTSYMMNPVEIDGKYPTLAMFTLRWDDLGADLALHIVDPDGESFVSDSGVTKEHKWLQGDIINGRWIGLPDDPKYVYDGRESLSEGSWTIFVINKGSDVSTATKFTISGGFFVLSGD